MTLLLSLVGKSGIHLSSDFRLTDIGTRKPIEDVFGSKQLHFSFQSFTAYVSFTGIAQVGPLRTVEETGCTLSLRKMSVAFRSVNYAGEMKLLSSSEELALSAPRKRVELTASKSTPTASANIEARFLLKDFDN